MLLAVYVSEVGTILPTPLKVACLDVILKLLKKKDRIFVLSSYSGAVTIRGSDYLDILYNEVLILTKRERCDIVYNENSNDKSREDEVFLSVQVK